MKKVLFCLFILSCSKTKDRVPAEETELRKPYIPHTINHFPSDQELSQNSKPGNEPRRRWSGPLPAPQGPTLHPSCQNLWLGYGVVGQTQVQSLIKYVTGQNNGLFQGQMNLWDQIYNEARFLKGVILQTGQDQLMLSLSRDVSQVHRAFMMIEKGGVSLAWYFPNQPDSRQWDKNKAEPEIRKDLRRAALIAALRRASTSDNGDCLGSLLSLIKTVPDLLGTLNETFEKVAQSDRAQLEFRELIESRARLTLQIERNRGSDKPDSSVEVSLQEQLKMNSLTMIVYRIIYPELI